MTLAPKMEVVTHYLEDVCTSQTPLDGYLIITDSVLCPVVPVIFST